MKKLLVSALTNTIYLTEAKPMKDNPKMFQASGEKQDYTDEAIRAVFEWFLNNFRENEPNEAFELRFSGCPYVLRMTKETEEATPNGGEKE